VITKTRDFENLHLTAAHSSHCFLTMASPLLSSPALLFEENANSSVTQVVVHPLVLFHVLDHHTRRQEASSRVIGTLLGRRDGDVIEITNCFAVPHAERGEEVAIGKDFNKTMMALHMRTNRKEKASSADLIADTSSLIHEFYAGESEDGDPVHLIVDTRLQEDKVSVRVFKCTPLLIQGEALGNMFHEVGMSLKSNEPETICLHEMIQQSSGENSDKLSLSGNLQVSMEKLHEMVERTLDYVNAVVSGKRAPDAEMGRKITDALAAVPRVRPEVFDKLFHDTLQDLLMVTYLSNITRTQITIAEKLNASLGVV
jgi:translation initiation factor 3 subunit F